MLQMCPIHVQQSLSSSNKDEHRLNGFHPYPSNLSMSFHDEKQNALSFYKRKKLQLQQTQDDIPCDTPFSMLHDLKSEPDVIPLRICGRRKIDESDCRFDSCSSSRSNTEQILEYARDEMPGTCESSASTQRLEESNKCETSERDKCISILREQGVLKRYYYRKKRKYPHAILQCKACMRKGSAQKMIICDTCEGVYHLKCCHLSEKELPVDEWLCPKCRMRKFNKLKGDGFKRSANIMDGRRKSKNSSRILLMSRDNKPYVSEVRVGKGFQADVPEWSGPVVDDYDRNGEPLELEPSELASFNQTGSFKCCNQCFSSNWLQCKGISDAKLGNGAICGKWRRAPHYECQTNDWDCFSAVFWDPFHADCAAPQEAETDEVLRQVKRMQMVKSQWDGHSKEMKEAANSNKKDTKKVYVRKRTLFS